MRKTNFPNRRYSAVAFALVAMIFAGCAKKESRTESAVQAEQETPDVAEEAAGDAAESIEDAGILMQSDEEPIIVEPSE